MLFLLIMDFGIGIISKNCFIECKEGGLNTKLIKKDVFSQNCLTERQIVS
jgi:hypothetical protein